MGGGVTQNSAQTAEYKGFARIFVRVRRLFLRVLAHFFMLLWVAEYREIRFFEMSFLIMHYESVILANPRFAAVGQFGRCPLP